jgi:hypothetical protein
MRKSLLAVFMLLTAVTSLSAFSLFSYSERSWRKDVKKINKEMTEEEWGIAEFARDSLMSSWEKDWGDLTKEDYTELVNRCARYSRDKKAMVFWKMGKAGQKGLKALIVLAEDVARATGDYIDEKSDEYDRRHKDDPDSK